MRLGYRKAKTQPIICNTQRCLVLRQQYAMRMLPLLETAFTDSQPKRIINIDESWLNGSRFVRRVWAPVDSPASVPDKQVNPRLSLICALDTEGHLWFALTQANTNADVMCLFLRSFMDQLDRERPGWIEDTIILLDGAPYHTSALMQARLARLKLPVIFSAPYSYSTAPIVSDALISIIFSDYRSFEYRSWYSLLSSWAN